ncbi:hypothetical protein Avbf_14457 [Armadillidium vulgare]|nr:hypothetical protein Avbf_14457 [Armadillidium vulgare]
MSDIIYLIKSKSFYCVLFKFIALAMFSIFRLSPILLKSEIYSSFLFISIVLFILSPENKGNQWTTPPKIAKTAPIDKT